MNKIEKGKRSLNTFGIILIVIALLSLGFGVAGVVLGAIYSQVVAIVLGSVELVVCLCLVVYGVIFVWTSKALIATNGSIAEDNLAFGTQNQEKCQKCGMPLDPETKKCPNHKD